MATFPANDAHAIRSVDGKDIMWNSGEYGFKDEAALYGNSFTLRIDLDHERGR